MRAEKQRNAATIPRGNHAGREQTGAVRIVHEGNPAFPHQGQNLHGCVVVVENRSLSGFSHEVFESRIE